MRPNFLDQPYWYTVTPRRQPPELEAMPFEQKPPQLVAVVAYLAACLFAGFVALNVCGVL